MNDNDDELRNIALAVIAGVVALVIAGLIALATSSLHDELPTTSKNLAETEDAFGPVETVEFTPGSDRLSADAVDVLNRLSESARAHVDAAVHITTRTADDSAMADRRLQVLRHALEANGVAPGRIVVAVPPGAMPPPGAADGRVELRLQ